MFNSDGAISVADLLDRMNERQDLSEIEPDEEEEIVLGGATEHKAVAANDDKKRQRVLDWFRHLEYRAKVFSNIYPFEILGEGEIKVIYRKRLTLLRKLYVFLLVSSNLGYIEKRFWPKLTSCFEFLSAAALKSYLPGNAKVYVFGKNIMNRRRRYSGLLWHKLDTLRKDLKETLKVSPEDFEPRDSGDNGLDVVGWVPFQDKASGFLIILAQCACTPEWVNKQHATSYNDWSNMMSFTAYPNNMVFIPFCFRNSFGHWYRKARISKNILIDRLRLTCLLEDKRSTLKNILPFDILDQIISHREDLF